MLLHFVKVLRVCVLFYSQDRATSQPSLKRYKHLTVPPLPPRQTVTPSDWPPVTSTWTTWETALGTLPIPQLVLNTSFPPIPARIVLPNLQVTWFSFEKNVPLWIFIVYLFWWCLVESGWYGDRYGATVVSVSTCVFVASCVSLTKATFNVCIILLTRLHKLSINYSTM